MNIIDTENIKTRELACKGCTNQCAVVRFTFENGNICYSGNKCEKVFFSKNSAKTKGYNAFEVKNKVLFDSQMTEFETPLLKIGIPRVLNMYENFPFWKTLLEECGFEVVLSPESNMELYKKGVSSVMSDNICFPAKLAHGHILALVEQQVDRIFYPIVPKDEKELDGSNNSFNCPVVSGYPEVIRSSLNVESAFGIPFDKPVMNFANEKILKKQCLNYIQLLYSNKKLSSKIFELAFDHANLIRKNYNREFIENQIDILQQCVENGELCFIVAGRPYHADPLVNQKTGQILSDLGVNVLTDDVFRFVTDIYSNKSQKATDENNSNLPYLRTTDEWATLNIVSQWSYPNRVIQAALAVAKLPHNIQLLQLNSFGCGPDSFFMEETGEILRQAGKNHTVLRIDEISSAGSIRLRLRSLIESIKQKNQQYFPAKSHKLITKR